MKHIGELLIDYAMAMGCTPAMLKKGIWKNDIDDNWTIKCNGQDKVVDGIPPFSWYIQFNEWPAGSLSIAGDGVMASGKVVNENTLRKAIESKMKFFHA